MYTHQSEETGRKSFQQCRDCKDVCTGSKYLYHPLFTWINRGYSVGYRRQDTPTKIMAEVPAHKDNPSYKCLLCLSECKIPRQLPCFHTFCTSCLDTYINSEYVLEDNRTYFPCPVCESPCSPNNKEAPVSSWAGSFPLHPNFGSLTCKKTESSETFCHGCLTDGEESVGSFWCRDCKEVLCKQCRVAHRRSTLLSKHNVIAIDEVTKSDVQLPVTIDETCPHHAGKTIEVYCIDHNALCCVLCVTLSHRSCQNVSSLEDMTKKITPGFVESGIDKINNESKRIVDEDENKLTALATDYQSMTKDMATMIKKAKDKLDDLQADFETGLDHTYKRNKDSLLDRLRTNKVFQTNVQNTNQLMLLMKERGSDCQQFITAEQSKTQIIRHVRRLQQRTKDKHNTFEMKIKYDETLEKVTNVMTNIGTLDVSSSLSPTSLDALTSIGTIIDTLQSTPFVTPFTESTSSSDIKGAVEKVAVQSSSGKQRVDVLTGSLSLIKSVHRSVIGWQKMPFLTGGVFIDGEGLYVTEFNNQRILVFDDQYNYVRQYDVDGFPTDITKGFAPNEVLIALLNAPILRCAIQGGVLTTVGSITSAKAWGVNTLGDKILIGKNNTVQFLTSNGVQRESFSKSGGYTYVAVSPHGFFFHRDGDVIVCRSRDGTEVFRHMCKGMREPRGITVDQDCNVYVCGKLSGGVHLISPDGSKDTLLLSKMYGFTEPYAIMLHPTRQEVIVTSSQEEVVLEVYKFCGL
ncbi:E3 ubiquitin-protein ligase Midline-1-like isoform X1 [Mizuhopecten yessoensis]|uniref:E3 ubiquitin-protein ligase Midline-1-like isoform X1 n=1 Tax=Mizuhopecten yessoensis TaxID=6573 RepID=UPI000B45A595|nr:E3 ubiquitin-protein ligase Midline-1-like isoform X1 [Mizuhopecten yessoensis]